MSKAKLIVVLGAGGVGKTTSSASLALRLAELGYRSCVITVDPAKRLAQALGLQNLSHEAQVIESFSNGGVAKALWLDTQFALKDVIVKNLPPSFPAERILNHRLFQLLQNQLGGVEEYLGVERVIALAKSGEYDYCVLDTPPSRHALDFLESPRHLLRFFDEGVLKVFLSNDNESKSSGFFDRIFQSSKNQVIEVFKAFLGKSFLGELGDLLSNLKPIYYFLKSTAEEIESWTRSADARTVLVTSLEHYPLEEARLLGIELSARSLPQPAVVILNKSLPETACPGGETPLPQKLQRRWELQQKFAQRALEVFPKSVVSRVPRYSIQRLSRHQLMQMGAGVIQSWQSKDPTFFSANSSTTSKKS